MLKPWTIQKLKEGQKYVHEYVEQQSLFSM